MTVFVAALPAEARPLIDALKLRRALDKPWPCYADDGGEHTLLLSGMGQLNAAAACAWLVGRRPQLARQPWLNVGIAGHRALPVGSLRWVERIRGQRGDSFPALHLRSTLTGAALQSVEQPSTDYPPDCLLDMEGNGFYHTCIKFAPLELVHLLKVVSDNQSSPLERLDKQTVSDLIQTQLPAILEFANALQGLAGALPEAEPAELAACQRDFERRWRFSHSQGVQLHKLLLRHHAVSAELPNAASLEPSPRDARQVLATLEARLAALPTVLA